MLMKNKVNRLPFHYGWVIVATGTVCIFASLGFGRFALGMLLPSMAETLKLSYSQMGYISTGNFLGYLVAVLVSGPLVVRLGFRRLITVALLIIGASMILISQAKGFLYLLLLYTITGIGSGASNVPMMGMVASWFTRRKRGRAAGFIVIGSGFAIILSGKLIPYVNSIAGADGWRINWLILGLTVVVISFICFLLLRDRPEEIGLLPVGTQDSSPDQNPEIEKFRHSIYREKVVYLLGGIYFLFGYTYVIYATFIVTTLVHERGFSESIAGNFWSWVGFLSLFSGPLFGTLSDRLGRKTGLISVFALHMTAYLLVASGLPDTVLYVSIFCFGISAWSIPSIMVAATGDYVGTERAVAAFGFVTFIFGLGQITGPAVAGVLAEQAGSFSSSFLMAGIFAGVAILLTFFLRSPRAG
jgi:MFS family permease